MNVGGLLFLRLFEEDALAEYRVEFHQLDFTGYGFLVLARPDNVRRLRGLELKQAVL